jgi:hypothetical protein
MSNISSTSRAVSARSRATCRFSITVSVGKIRRSSGTILRPRLLISSTDISLLSSPSYSMRPSRRGMVPVMVRSVVVLPAPFRPSSVTTSFSRSSIARSNRTWLLP